MLLCPETFQSWAFGLCSVLTWAAALTTVYILGNSLLGGLRFTPPTFPRYLGEAPVLGLQMCSCSLWFGGSGPGQAAMAAWSQAISLDPISCLWVTQDDRTPPPAAPLTLWHEEKGCFKVFALFKQCSWKLRGFISFILLPLENNMQTNKTTTSKETKPIKKH